MFKTKLFRSCLISLLIAFPMQAQAHAGHCEDTRLGEIMSQMKKANKKLKKALSKARIDDALAHTNLLLKLGDDALPLTPLKLKKDNSLSIEKYKASIEEVKTLLGNIKAALRQGKLEQAEELFSGLKKLKKQGHRQFRLECD